MATRAPRERPRFYVPPTYIRQREPLPYPATTLVVTQHLFTSHCGRYWAWLIVGTFYDRFDKAIWSSEVFMAMNPDEDDSGDESDEDSGEESSVDGSAEDESGTESEEALGSDSESGGELSRTGDERRSGRVDGRGYQASRGEDIPTRDAYSRRHIDSRLATVATAQSYSQASLSTRQPLSRRPPRGIYSPPQYWDPARHGPVPGHWNAEYDPDLGWISYFQPHSGTN